LTLSIPSARSLKDKRRVIRSLVARLRSQYNASVAEVGDNDLWQSCRLGVAVVSNQQTHADSQLTTIVKAVQQEREAFLVDYEIEFT
jgi:uncharacterized protein YlxP (DUF503 family)